MKRIIILALFFLGGQSTKAQVGINTTNPNSILDIEASNSTSPTNLDGILIPRIDDFPSVNPTANQDGMMVFLNVDIAGYNRGFYYWDNNNTDWIFLSTGGNNTLDEAYDQGGAGVGKNITADNGAVSVNGNDGFLVTGTFNSGSTIDTEVTGAGTRMFFNPRKAAFRAGTINGTQWNNTNIGNNSAAFGLNNIASGNQSVAFGQNNISNGSQAAVFGNSNTSNGLSTVVFGENNNASGAFNFIAGTSNSTSGENSTAIGQNLTVGGDLSLSFGESNIVNNGNGIAIGSGLQTFSRYETAFGTNNTTYVPINITTFNSSDRLFVIGNGANPTSKSNALTIYKSGLMNINDEYNMPLTDGTINQILSTDGSGQLSFVDPSSFITPDRIDDLIDGKSDNDGTDNGSSIFLGINSGTLDDLSNNENIGIGINTLASNINGNNNVAIGTDVLTLNTIGNNVGVGSYALSNSSSGASNTAIGSYSMRNTTTGNFNTSVGYVAAFNNTDGERNTAIGNGSLYENTTGSNNTALGYESLHGNISGTRNVALGHLAMYRNASGSGNTAVGASAGQLTRGSNNVFIGDQAGFTSTFNNKSGSIFIGYQAGLGETTSNKLYIENSNGNENNALIYGEFDTNTLRANGEFQIGNPAVTGYALPIGDGTNNQVMITNGSGVLSWQSLTGEASTASNGLNLSGNDIRLGGTLTQDTSITYGSFDTRLNLDGTGDFIIQDAGIGKFSVLDNGDTVLGGDLYWRDENTGGTILAQMIDDANDARFILRENGNISVDLDTNSGFVFNEQGFDRDFIIESSGLTNMFHVDSGTNRIGIGTSTPDGRIDIEGNSTGSVGHLELTEQQANDGARLRFNNSFETDNQWTLYGRADDTEADARFNIFYSSIAGGSGGNVIVATGDGYVGIRRTPTTNELEVNGTASKSTAGNWLANSDRRLKAKINTINTNNALNKLLALRGVTYEWDDNKTGIERPSGIQYGFVAQELMEVFPEKVSMDSQGYYQTAYGDYDAIFVQAFKEMNSKIETLETENAILKQQLNELQDIKERLLTLEEISLQKHKSLLAND